MGRPRRHENARLTKKQQTFAELVVTKEGELTLRECAQQAGYSVSSSHTRAYELLNPRISPHVVAEVRRRREELNEKYAVDYGRHVRSLAKLRDESLANGAYSAAVNAERLRGQAAGLYVSKSEVRIGSIDQMSKAEVEKALAELKRNMGGTVLDAEDAEIVDAEIVEGANEQQPRGAPLVAIENKQTH